MSEHRAHSALSAWRSIAAWAALLCASAAGLTWAATQGLFGAEAAAAAHNSDEGVRLAAARRAEELAFSEPFIRLSAARAELRRGESLRQALIRSGAPGVDASLALAALSTVYSRADAQEGLSLDLTLERDAPEGPVRLTGLSFRPAPGASIAVARGADGRFVAREVLMPLTFEIARIAAPVRGGLNATARRLGATNREIDALGDAFSYDVDFQRDVRPGDRFELVFERFYDDEGRTVRTGALLFVSLETRQGARHLYHFQGSDGRTDWYDSQGRNVRRALMRTPVNGAHLSSGFGWRLHPILGYSAMHQGVDFRAPIGTPVMAAGDGVVVRAGSFSSYGHYVRIRHPNGLETAYAHLSRYGAGMRPGLRVRQGQVIGYVGNTGRSTGPHLHYEVLRGGRQINPMTVRIANGRNLDGRDLQLFTAERERIDRLRQARALETSTEAAAAVAASRDS